MVTGGAEVSHTYTDGGTFAASVTPVDAAGNRGLTRTADEVTVLVDPVATATATPRCGVLPLEVSFTGAATDPQDQDVSWAWDFGVDGADTTLDGAVPDLDLRPGGRVHRHPHRHRPRRQHGHQSARVEVLANGECRPVADLSELFDNDGISTDANPGDGNFDGGGWSFAAELLPAEVRENGGP